jgi:hypothetical protein
MMGLKHHTFIYDSGYGLQVAVEVWDDGGVDVKMRPNPSAIWSLPLRQVSDDGDPIQFAFEKEE